MMSGTSEAEATSGKQNGETFNEEMKDYAKSTMNEFLGMFGYKEEITREAVEELQIRLLPEEDEQPRNDVLSYPVETNKDIPVVVNINGDESPVVVQIPDNENGSSPSVLSLPAGNNAVSPVQPLPEASINSSGAGEAEASKPGAALAPHFLAEPPNIKGVYCVVANLPVVSSGCKTNVAFKFWNCIMCSEYFVQKPEVVFRVEHPHLFGSHPAWLYQAAVCQKCHRMLKASKQGAATCSAPEDVSSEADRVDAANGNQESGALTSPQIIITNNASKLSDAYADVSSPTPDSHVVGTFSSELPLLSSTATESKECEELAEVLFDCYVCSKPVYKNSRHGKLRRSKFPTLFSNLPEIVGVQKVCFTCSERLTRQRDRFVHAGITEESRDYAAYIKIWTGLDFSSKVLASTAKNSDCSTCFVCEKYIPQNVEQGVKTLNKTRFPSLFSVVPGRIMKLLTCDSCYRKLVKVKSRFDENGTVEEERDYWVHINSWRDKKGLENHMYSKYYP